ncbi:MAG: hypothetical protein HYV18_06495 [Gammaproteobacteria bacterium]|nr:hypothetical protein [Gammaproteobacteria bacterium]
MDELRPDNYEVVSGVAAFAQRAAELVAGARNTLDVLSCELDRRIYGSEEFLQNLRKFVLQHRHARLRVLLNAPARALAGGNRLVEFGRAMSSFIEFRELPPERLDVREECVVADGRLLLVKAAPEQLNAKFYPDSPHLARLKLKDFDALWNESPPAQELRDLRL